MQTKQLSYIQTLQLAVPVMLAQAAIAATGVVDTIVMTRFGDKLDIGAVGIASVAFSFIYWGFGFLRMSTTGLVAQAQGAERFAEARAVLQRALLLGAAFGLAILTLSPLLKTGAFLAFGAEAAVEDLGAEYFNARIWGAPALLMQYGIMGWLLGMGRTGTLLLLQVVMNAINIALDIWFVAVLDWGPAGIGAGTAIAEWVAGLLGLYLVRGALKREAGLFDRAALIAVFNANRDILIRTLALLLCFAWFVRSGTLTGTANLAGNEILLQFITVAAFVLDGYAFVAEKEVGEAYGAGRKRALMRAMTVTTVLAVLSAVLISALYGIGGAALIAANVVDAEARAVALTYLPYCALVPLLGVLAYQFDGFLIGATQGRALRNAAAIMAVTYIPLDLWLRPAFGNTGVWIAFLMMFAIRTLIHGWYVWQLVRVMPNQPQLLQTQS